MLNRIIIHNYRLFQDFDLSLDKKLNIIVGDNETGKSTILEAINIGLTKKLNGRFIENELSPHLFNNKTVENYLSALKSGNNPILPNIFIELYFDELPALNFLRGTNNSLREDQVGIRFSIAFNEDFKEEYEKLLEDKDNIKLIPIEYYKVNWQGFDGNQLTTRRMPIGASFIDTTTIRLQSGTDYYLQNIINDDLDVKERVELTVAYRKLKERFSEEESIKKINNKIDEKKASLTDKKLSIAIDVSQKASWETHIVPHVDELPFQLSGKGEQNSLKIMLALERKANETHVVLIEEPENHQSFASMNMLLRKIKEKCNDKQIIIATHSSFVLNKLGLDKLILIRNGQYARLEQLPKDTQNYFKKLSGYDTLRLILAKAAILVEGPSDELLVQKAYRKKHGDKLPIENGIDVISVRGLSFKRFLDIAKELNIQVTVVTDNDGDHDKVNDGYKDYVSSTIKIFFDKDNAARTLEPQIMKCNNRETLNSIYGTKYEDSESLGNYMAQNKTECALKLFDTDIDFIIPQYIQNAVQ